ncbi:MAG: hypothetical protein IPG59_15020 [Candidatus Melainabacteria bacterium]|nr:MAG: hypothetical protein IPG59_15020 [Candidatus Melainabacteria bacterium]
MSFSSPNSSQSGVATIGYQFVIAVLFGALFFLAPLTISQLQIAGLDPQMLACVPDSFRQYLIWLATAFFLCALFTFFDMKRPQNVRKPLAFYVTLSFFLFYLVLTRALHFPMCVDDAYIDFRYVINWVNNIGFDYNPTERVMGFTSHLHIALLTMLLAIFKSVDLGIISQNLNTALSILCYFLTFIFVRGIAGSGTTALMSAAVFALLPYAFQESMSGKEAVLLMALMLACLLSIQKNKPHQIALYSALILLTRPEGAVWCVLAFMWTLRDYGKAAIKAWIGPALILGLVGGLLYAAYGTVVPHSLLGKSLMFYKPFMLMDLVLVLRRLADGTLIPELNYFISKPWSDVYDFARLYAGVIVLLLTYKLLDIGALRFYGLTVFAYFLVFSILNPYLFPWYFGWFGLVPVFLVPIMVSKLYSAIKQKYVPSRGASLQKTLAIFALIVLCSVQIVQQPFRAVPGLPAITFWWNGAFQRLLIYKKAALAIKEDDPSTISDIASPEVGVIGHYYPGPILDLGGLVCDNVLKYGPPPKELQVGTGLFSIIPKIIEDMKPRYIITDASFAATGLIKEPWFFEKYKQFKFYPLQLWSDGFYVYKLKEPGSDK